MRVEMAIDKRPRIGMHLVGKQDGPKHIVLTERPWRSKYATLVCFCKRRRKDGTCLLTEPLIAMLRNPERAYVQHPKIDERRFRISAARPAVVPPAEQGER